MEQLVWASTSPFVWHLKVRSEKGLYEPARTRAARRSSENPMLHMPAQIDLAHAGRHPKGDAVANTGT